MTDAYVADFAGGNRAAIASMIDFYGGAGTYASWPAKVRSYAEHTTPVNILDWASGYAFPLNPAALAAIDLPTLVLCGGQSHPAMQCVNAALAWSLAGNLRHRRLGGAPHDLDPRQRSRRPHRRQHPPRGAPELALLAGHPQR